MSGPPEPDDGGFTLVSPWDARSPHAIEVWVRNDAHAKSEGDQRRHWFLTGTHNEGPLSWTELRYHASGFASIKPMSESDW